MANPFSDVLTTAWNGFVDLFILAPGAQDVAADTRRAYGINPETGDIPSVYSGAAAGIGDAEQKAVNQYITGYHQAFEANGGISFLPFSPAVGGDKKLLSDLFSFPPFGGDGSGPGVDSSWLVPLLVVLVLLFVFVKVIK